MIYRLSFIFFPEYLCHATTYNYIRCRFILLSERWFSFFLRCSLGSVAVFQEPTSPLRSPSQLYHLAAFVPVPDPWSLRDLPPCRRGGWPLCTCEWLWARWCVFATVNKPRPVSTGEGGGLLGQPRKSRNPTSMLNVEMVRCLEVEQEQDWRQFNGE